MRRSGRGQASADCEADETEKTINTTMKRITSIIIPVAAAASLLITSWLRAAEIPSLMEPVKSVFDHYLKIQGELAKDSLKGVDDHASAIANAVKGDDMKMLSPEVAKEAEALSTAKTLKEARAEFKDLSSSLIKYVSDNKIPKGTYYEAYCPMVKASWLQADKKIANPYMGKQMPGCGTIKN